MGELGDGPQRSGKLYNFQRIAADGPIFMHLAGSVPWPHLRECATTIGRRHSPLRLCAEVLK